MAGDVPPGRGGGRVPASAERRNLSVRCESLVKLRLTAAHLLSLGSRRLPVGDGLTGQRTHPRHLGFVGVLTSTASKASSHDAAGEETDDTDAAD